MTAEEEARILATLTPEQREAIYEWLIGVDYDNVFASYLWCEAFLADGRN